MKHCEVGVIGLGKFGLEMAATLVSLGHKVLGVDTSESRVHLAQDVLEHVYRIDAADTAVLRQLRFQDLEYVIISVGQAMDMSLSITLNVQELGVPHVWVKATSTEHRKILKRLGVEHAILPEHDVATLAAHRLGNPGLLDRIPRYGGILVQELSVDKWAGKNLIELNLMNTAEVLVLAVRRSEETDYTFVPRAHTRLEKGDVLMVVGKQENVLKLLP